MRIERRRINLGTQHSTLFFHISRRREQQAQQFVRERMNPIHRFNPGTAHPQINEVFRREIPAMPPATSGEERDLVIEHRHVPRPNVAAREAANLSLARRDRRPDPHRPKLSPVQPKERCYNMMQGRLAHSAELGVGERDSYNRLYGSNSGTGEIADLASLQRSFIRTDLSPFKAGGATKGLARGLALRKMLADIRMRRQDPAALRVLDAGCGRGSLSLFLASLGFGRVLAVDLSDVAIGLLQERAARLGVTARITAHAGSLEDIPIEDGGIDLIIGFALGNVILTRHRIRDFFGPGLDITLFPVDWFAMLDKLYLKVLPRSCRPLTRRLGSLHYALDRAIPMATSLALSLSGGIVTQAEKGSGAGGLQIGHLPVDDLMAQDPRTFGPG
jgi:SAM-dependent methyltransferase